MSIDYYDHHGEIFFGASAFADIGAAYARFLAHVPKGGAILDAGCGSGRDALAFRNAGYDVTAMDGSSKMAQLAKAHSGLEVLHKRFDEIDWHDRFDGVWTCASLLHVPRADLPDTLQRLKRALKPGGIWFLSFKSGETERRAKGRYFNDLTEPMLDAALREQGLSVLALWTDADARPGREQENWTNALARR